MIGVVPQLHAGQRILLRTLLLTERSPVGQAYRLFQTEGRRFRMIIGCLVHRHAETLSQGRFFQGHRKRDEGLVTLYRYPISLGMKERSLFFGVGQGTVGQGEAYPYLYAPSAGAYQSSQRLWQQSRLRLDQFRFRQSRKMIHLYQYDAIVLLEFPATVLGATELSHGIDARNLVQVDKTVLGSLQGRQSFPQLRDVFSFRFSLHFFHECFHGTNASYFSCICLS